MHLSLKTKNMLLTAFRKFVPIPLAAAPWYGFSMMLRKNSSKLKCFPHLVAGGSKQEARRMSQETRIPHFSLSYFNLSMSEQRLSSSADPRNIGNCRKCVFHGYSCFPCLYCFSSLLGYLVKRQGFLLIALF